MQLQAGDGFFQPDSTSDHPELKTWILYDTVMMNVLRSLTAGGQNSRVSNGTSRRAVSSCASQAISEASVCIPRPHIVTAGGVNSTELQLDGRPRSESLSRMLEGVKLLGDMAQPASALTCPPTCPILV
jgi:hypothetical protein